MSEEYVSQTPINGFEYQSGGVGGIITGEWLEAELKRMLVIKPDEKLSQYNIKANGDIVYYVSKEEVK